MLFEYCPECAGMDFRILKSSEKECNRCGFVGSMKSAGMDEINAFKKSLGNKPIVKRVHTEAVDHKNVTPNQLREKLQALKGKKTEDSEFL